MSTPTYFGSSETNEGCPLPPYNTTSFTPANPVVYSTLVSYANNLPNYPLPPQTDARLVTLQRRNVMYYQSMNVAAAVTVSTNQNDPTARVPYPQFKSEGERIMYLQGLHANAARSRFTGQNPSLPAGVPASTMYQIINRS